jgi:hypothetical protein
LRIGDAAPSEVGRIGQFGQSFSHGALVKGFSASFNP